VDFAGIKKNALGRRGFAGVDVRRDADVARETQFVGCGDWHKNTPSTVASGQLSAICIQKRRIEIGRSSNAENAPGFPLRIRNSQGKRAGRFLDDELKEKYA